MLVYKSLSHQHLVSVLFHNQLTKGISHTILDENEDVFQQLVKGEFNATWEGKDLFLEISTESDLQRIRQITKMPLFITF